MPDVTIINLVLSTVNNQLSSKPKTRSHPIDKWIPRNWPIYINQGQVNRYDVQVVLGISRSRLFVLLKDQSRNLLAQETS